MTISVSKSHLDSLSLQRCVDELKQLYFPFKTEATSVIPSKTQEKFSKQFVGVLVFVFVFAWTKSGAGLLSPIMLVL